MTHRGDTLHEPHEHIEFNEGDNMRRSSRNRWGALCLAAASPMVLAQNPPDPLPVAPFATVARPVSAVAPEPVTELQWEVKSSDVTLAKTLERWAAASGHKLKWDASRNFLIGAPDLYVGTFEGALQHILRSPGIRYSDYPLEACVYANTPPLVRITRQGEQSRECAPASAP